jgi:hypothetical protein
MKKIFVILCVSLYLFGGIFSASAQQHSLDQVMEAMSISMGAYFMAAMMSGMGNTPDSVSFDQETGNLSFDNYSLTDMNEMYSSISGNVTGSEEEGFRFDFSLQGGPISTLRYTLTDQEMQNQPEEVVIFADGQRYVLPIEEMQQQ